MTENFPTPNDATDTTRFRVPFETYRAEIDAVPETELIPVTVDVPSAVTMLLGAIPEVKKLAPELARLSFTDPLQLERIEPYTLSLFHAHTQYLVASRPPVPVTELVAVLTKDRDFLHANALSLAMSDLYDRRTLEEFRGTTGYKTLSVDVHMLCNGFRARWPVIEGKTTVTLAELDRIEMTNEQLLSALGERERAPAAVAASALVRQKAFTLVARTWDDIRRGVHYLRWKEDDADAIAPSIYAGRTSRRRDDAAEATPPAGDTPAVTAPTAPSTPTIISPFAPAAPTSNVPPGLPGASPFLRE